jgi:tRNA(Arg) A34 adenosine deaminase TadA
MYEPEALMRLAIEKARLGVALGQSPFGCAIARGDELLAAEHNVVLLTTDITAHAEIGALRAACPRAGDIILAGCVAASTCEPCPMCMAALHWAQIETVYYGAEIADATSAGFNELQIPAATIVALGKSKSRLVPGVLAAECRELFQMWKSNPAGRHY